MASTVSTMAEKPTCKAIKPNGERCRQTMALGADGLCAYHGGRNDVRSAGRRGGLKPKVPGGKKGRGGFRAHILGQISPATLTAAIESGLASPKEADRLAAARLVLAESPEPRPAPEPPAAPDGEDRSASLVSIVRVLLEVGALGPLAAKLLAEGALDGELAELARGRVVVVEVSPRV